MKRPSTKEGSGRLLRKSRSVVAALKSRKATAKFAVKLKAAHELLKKAQEALNVADDHLIDVRAGVSTVHFDTKECITDAELTLLLEVKKDRTDARYKAVFPERMTKIKARSVEDFHEWFTKTVVPHVKSLPADRPLKKFQKQVEALAADWKEPLADLEHAELRLETAQTALNTAKEAWLDAYVSTYGALQEAFPRRRSFVEAFFPEEAPRKNGKEKGSQQQQP